MTDCTYWRACRFRLPVTGEHQSGRKMNSWLSCNLNMLFSHEYTTILQSKYFGKTKTTFSSLLMDNSTACKRDYECLDEIKHPVQNLCWIQYPERLLKYQDVGRKSTVGLYVAGGTFP